MLRAKGTSITRFIDVGMTDVSPSTKWIKFTDVGMGEGTLDQYLLGRHASVIGTGGSRVGKFRPIGMSDNEVCMFSATATIRLCTVVASLFSKSRATYTFDATPLVEPFLLNRNNRDMSDMSEEIEPTTAPIIQRRKSVSRRNTLEAAKKSGSGRQEVPQTSDSNTGLASNNAGPARSASSPQQRQQSVKPVPPRRR